MKQAVAKVMGRQRSCMPRLVRRTVTVLSIVSSKPVSLTELYDQTGIHRSTLLRILNALISEELVRRSSGDGKYRVTHKVRNWGQRLSASDHLAEVACELLKAHAEAVKWPTDLLMLHPQHPCLVVIETNRPQSPFPVKLNQIGHTVPLLPSAAGRTYLAFLSEKKRESMLHRLLGRARTTLGQTEKYEELQSDLQAVNERGFGNRARFFRGGNYRDERSERDGLLAQAVPVFHNDSVVAVVNTQWNSKAHNEEEFSTLYLSKQIDLAGFISAKLSKPNEIIV